MADAEAAVEMETVVVTRAFKAAAATLGFMSFLLTVVTTAATSWVTNGEERPYQTLGLFEKCVVSAQVADEKVIALQGPEVFDCNPYEVVESWRLACQVLMALAVVFMFVSFVLLTVGICSAVENTKFTLYKVAIVGLLIVVVLSLIALIVYPTMAISAYSKKPGFENWSLGWVYVLAWVNTVVIFIIALTVIIDKGEELTEREKVPEEEEEAEE